MPRESKDYLSRLFSLLSRSELIALRDSISSPDRRSSLLRLIDVWLLHQEQINSPIESTESETVNAAQHYPWETLNDRRAISILLADRDALPTSQEAVKVINAAFGTRLNPVDYLKKSRDTLIERAWLTYEQMTREKQTRAMTRLIGLLPTVSSEKNNDYQRLFRFLTRDERRK